MYFGEQVCLVSMFPTINDDVIELMAYFTVQFLFVNYKLFACETDRVMSSMPRPENSRKRNDYSNCLTRIVKGGKENSLKKLPVQQYVCELHLRLFSFPVRAPAKR